MKNIWSDKEASQVMARYRRQDVAGEVAELVYASRLLGSDPSLVLHGGGNTSAKLSVDGDSVLYVKGSGRDMSAIGPDGFTALRLSPLQDLHSRRTLDDRGMMDALSSAKLSADAPAPSVETLLHTFLPQGYVFHTHANAVLAVTNQSDAETMCAKVFGGKVAVVPYVMSGFALAKRAARVLKANPDVDGLIVPHHGIFTFGDTAKQCYRRMTGLVRLAERYIEQTRTKQIPARRLPKKLAALEDVAPVVRGLFGDDTNLIADFRTGKVIRAFVDGRDLARYGMAGTATPDHVIRTKPTPLILPAPAQDQDGGLNRFRDESVQALANYKRGYERYIRRNAKRHKGFTPTDSNPRVVLVPGLGLFGLGDTAAAAKIAADIAEANVATITDAERIGRFQPLAERHVFDIEYWPLERAKLNNKTQPALAGRVVFVTGGAGAIGRATANAFREAGAEVVVSDVDFAAANDVATEVGGLGVACDVTKPESVRRAFDTACRAFGGIDIVISNAGAAWQGEIGTVSETVLRESFELNFFAHQSVAQNAVRVMRAQGNGGALLFNTSKQAVNPGENFGPYGLPKAATLFLVRQYAVDHGKDGIRSNGVNADRIRSGLLTEEMIRSRAESRKLSEDDYMAGNLLGVEVTADDVAQAFVSLALAGKTTGAVLTVDGGNIAAALR